MMPKPSRNRRYLCLLTTLCLSMAWGDIAHSREQPFMGAYLHIPHLFDSNSDISERERSIEQQLDRFKAAGLRVVMPYVTTTSGAALYPSKIIDTKLYSDWDPVSFIVRAAHKRGLQVYPVTCVLACGKQKPKGILLKHPEWALRDTTGNPIGHISPCDPEARAWIVSVMKEIVEKYKPDGMLLDYLRFNNRPMQLDPYGAAELKKQFGVDPQAAKPQQMQQFKEACLTKLMREISRELRQQEPGIKVAIYSWGPHVTNNHRVAQDWKTWAQKKYIDMVNVSGYCYRENYGDRYLQVFKNRINGALNINRQLGQPIEVTLCLGIVTSHGKIDKAADVNEYLTISEELGIDGAAIFTWSTLQPYLKDINQEGYFKKFNRDISNRNQQIKQ